MAMDKDKLFLVCYLNIGSIPDENVSEYLNSFAEAFTYDESIEKIIVSIRKGESRIECINPVLLTEEQYEETRKKIESLTEKVEEAIKTLKENKG